MSQLIRHLLLIVVVASLALFPHLGATRLWDRDEPRNAGCAREMLERGDWVVPTFNHELRVLKPVMAYWCTMTAYQAFGVSEWSARLWSALFALGSSILTYFLGRRLFDDQAGLWAALILSTSLLWDTTGHLATVDAHLMFFSALALCCYVYGVFPAGANSPTRAFPGGLMHIACYAAIGLATLTKGLVGLVPPLAVIGIFLLIWRLRKRNTICAAPTWKVRLLNCLRAFAPGHVLTTCRDMRLLSGALIALAVAAPWYVLVGIHTDGEFLRGFFLEHHFGRAMNSMEGHGGPFLLYYLGSIAIGFFPWSVFLPAALAYFALCWKHRDEWTAGFLFAVCWIAVYLFIFSVPRTKLPSYIAPCYPALALLAGGFVQRWLANFNGTYAEFGVSPRWIGWSLVLLGGSGLLLSVAAVVAARFVMPGREWLAVIGLFPLGGAVAAWLLLKRERLPAAGAALVVAALGFITAFFGIGLVQLDRKQQQEVLFSAVRAQCDDPKMGWFGCLEPTWVFYLEKPILPLVVQRPGMPLQATSDWVHAPQDAATWFRGGHDRFIITNSNDFQWLKDALPADAVVLAECQWFLRKPKLLVIGHASQTATGKTPQTNGL